MDRSARLARYACAIAGASATACSILFSTGDLAGGGIEGGEASVADAGADSDARSDAAPPRCDVRARFTTIVPLTGPDGAPLGPNGAFRPTLSPDESTIIVSAARPDAGTALWRAERTGPAAFGPLVELLPLALVHRDIAPSLDVARGVLAFYSDRVAPGPIAPTYLYLSTRAPDGTFGAPVRVESLVPGTNSDSTPFLSADGRELFLASYRNVSTSLDLFRAERFEDGGFGEPTRIGEPNNPMGEEDSPALSFDGLTLYFASDRGFATTTSIFVTHRSSTAAAFDLPSIVDELFNNLPRSPSWLSSDNCRLYFGSYAGGRASIEVAIRQP